MSEHVPAELPGRLRPLPRLWQGLGDLAVGQVDLVVEPEQLRQVGRGHP